MVNDLFAIVDAIGELPVLVGASMGGLTALMAEGERGPIARGLVLVDIVARPDPIGVARVQDFMASAPNGFATLDEAADAINAFNPHRPRPASTDGLRRNLVEGVDGRWRWHWDPKFLDIRSEPERDIDYERAVAASRRIQIPTMLVRGGHSEVVSPEGLVEMERLIPHARVVEVQSAGHMIAGDDNDVFTLRLAEFLADLPAEVPVSAPSNRRWPTRSRA